MPTFHHGKDSQLLVDEYDLSSYFNSFGNTRSADTAETSYFGLDDKVYIPGMRDATVSLDGLWSADEDNTVGTPLLDEVFDDALGSGTVVYSVAVGGLTAGQPCIIGQTIGTQWDITQSTTAVVATTAGLSSSGGGVGRGICLHDISAAATANASGSGVDQTAQSTSGGFATLHVIASDGTATIKVQDSSDNSTWADLITFNATATAEGQFGSVAGTVDRYVRYDLALGTATSITFALNWRRQPT